MARRKKRRAAPADERKAPDEMKNRPFAEALRELEAAPAPEKKPAPPPPPPPKPPAHTPDDRAAFEQAFAGVRKLGDAPIRRHPSAPHAPDSAGRPAPPSQQAVDDVARARLAALVGGGYRFRVDLDEDGHVSALRSDARPADLKTLARSAPDATLDLHGLHADEAVQAVVKFVRARRRRGDRVLCIVHGRGLHSEGGIGVLADRTIDALTAGGAGAFVRAFASAPARLGGTGAILVLLAGPGGGW
jgi:DNA-nicking Smr family endonuclease